MTSGKKSNRRSATLQRINPGIGLPPGTVTDDSKKLDALAKKFGASWSQIISLEKVVVAEWVALKCQFGCKRYNTNLSCPPRSPKPEVMRRVLSEYSRGLLVGYDGFENKSRGWKIIQRIVPRIERELFLAGNHRVFALATGPCHFCKNGCPASGICVHPLNMRPAMEACGIDVYQTLRNVGLELHTVSKRPSAVRYAGLILL